MMGRKAARSKRPLEPEEEGRVPDEPKTAVVVAGTATTRFGRHPDADLVDLAVAATQAALDDAGMTAEQVDALELGTFLGRSLQRRGVLASVVAERLGLGPVPTTVVEG